MANRNLGGEARWRERVERFGRSGLKPAAFAAREGVSVASLHRWVRRLSEADAPRFVEVALPRVRGDAALELVVGEVTVRVPAGFDEPTLGRVLALLGATR